MLLHFAQSSKVQISSWDVRHIHEIIPKTQVHKNSDSYVSLYCIYFATAPTYKCPVFRYSHSAHMIGGNLVVVGGVWLHSGGVPDVVVINLITRCCMEFRLDRVSQSSRAVLHQALRWTGKKSPLVFWPLQDAVPWPLMLHSFCSEIPDPEEPELLLLGGGGNCFSFGTHFNCHPVTVDLTTALHQSDLRNTQTWTLHFQMSKYPVQCIHYYLRIVYSTEIFLVICVLRHLYQGKLYTFRNWTVDKFHSNAGSIFNIFCSNFRVW